MRQPRLKPEGQVNVFHCISNAVGKQRLFHNPEKEQFRRLMWHYAAFCHMQIITHTMLESHFHIVVRAPAEVELTDDQLLAALEGFYGKTSSQANEFKDATAGNKKRLKKLREKYLKRMGDVSMFMKELKQAFSRWYNKRHDRVGTLWAARFTSLLVQDMSTALLMVAAYVDLNALRAGIVKDPKDYRYCGYAEAVGGNKLAQKGLKTLVAPRASWKEFQSDYRKYLFIQAGKPGHSGKAQLSREEILKVYEKGGELSIAQLLRLRIRYFTDGVVLGTQEYVEQMWRQFRKECSPKRKTGARKMKGGDWDGLMTMRDLQKEVIG
jgi:hypothetical protein